MADDNQDAAGAPAGAPPAAAGAPPAGPPPAGRGQPPPGPPDETIIGGAALLKELLIIGFIVAFVAVYGYFIVKIWQAAAGKPPSFSDASVALAGSLAGVLGSAFALALGVAKPGNAAPPPL